MFTLKVHYRSFDSFDSFEHYEKLGVSFSTIEEARMCLKCAKEHYEYTQLFFNLNKKGRPSLKDSEVVSLFKNKSWFDTSNDEADYSYDSRHTFYFNDQSISAFYAGPCDILYSIKIVYICTKEDKFITKKGI